MWEKLKGFGAGALGIGFFILLGLLIALFIHGGAWLGEKLYPWLVFASVLTLAACAVILLPLSLFRGTRPFAGNGLVIASFIFGVTLWLWGLILTYNLWGAIAVFIGLFLLGVGVVPIAMLATLFKGMWSTLGELVFLLFLVFGCRGLGFYVLSKADREAYDA